VGKKRYFGEGVHDDTATSPISAPDSRCCHASRLFPRGERANLSVASARFDGLPDVPTMSESVPGYEVSGVLGVGVPKGTPPEIIERLNREINAGLANPAIKARLTELVTTPFLPLTPAEFGAYMAAETEKWGKVVTAAGIKVD
jgi:tripartite-type tricarboxylate transporter receptor subunit TctC